MENISPLERTGYIPKSEDINIFKNGKETYVIDGNSLVFFECTDMIKNLLSLPNSFEKQEVAEALETKYEKEEVVKVLEEFDTIQHRQILISYGNFKQLKYRTRTYKLSLDVSGQCNLDCIYCYSKEGNQSIRNNEKMDWDMAKKAIDFFFTKFASQATDFEVNIVGSGEPLFNFKLIKKIREYLKVWENKLYTKIVFWVFTNGTVFTDEILNWFSENKQGISISIDGAKEIHDKLRVFPNKKGTYDKIVEEIEKLKKFSKGKGGLENFWVSVVLTRKHEDLISIFEELLNLKVKNVQIRPVRTRNTDLAISIQDVDRVLSMYEKFVKFLTNETLEGNLEYLNLILNERDFLGRFILRLLLRQGINFRCGAAKSKICVLANGDIYPCDISCGTKELKIGNIHDIQPIENSITDEYFKLGVTTKSYCNSCWAKFLCGGGCYFSAFLKNNQIDSPDEALCKLIKGLIELGIVFLSQINRINPELSSRLFHLAKMKERIIKM